MNIKMKSIVAVLSVAAAVFAAEPAAPATTESAPAAVEQTAAPASVEATSAAEPAPVAESAPVAETPVAETPVAEVPAETVNQPASAPVDEAAAPVAVRDGKTVAAPAPTETKVVYQPVYTGDPTAVRGSGAAPVQTVYVAQKPGKDTVTFEELRGFVPMAMTFGVQGFVGSYLLLSDDDDYYYDDFDEYTGMTWRAGVFGIFPLNEYTIGLKLGVFYEQSEASASSAYYEAKGKFKQRKIDVPVLFAFKAPRSSFMFEIGAEADFAITDKFKASFDNRKNSKIDMMDKDFRNPVDWNLVMGFSVKANRYVGLDLLVNLGLSNLYDADNSDIMHLFAIDGLSSSSFLLGLSFYVF